MDGVNGQELPLYIKEPWLTKVTRLLLFPGTVAFAVMAYKMFPMFIKRYNLLFIIVYLSFLVGLLITDYILFKKLYWSPSRKFCIVVFAVLLISNFLAGTFHIIYNSKYDERMRYFPENGKVYAEINLDIVDDFNPNCTVNIILNDKTCNDGDIVALKTGEKNKILFESGNKEGDEFVIDSDSFQNNEYCYSGCIYIPGIILCPGAPFSPAIGVNVTFIHTVSFWETIFD